MVLLRITIILALSIIVLSIDAYADIPENSSRILILQEKNHLVETLLDYKNQIFELKKDLIALKSDKEWLDVSIMKIESQARPVPGEMTKSRDLNLQKQNRAKMEISRLNSLCSQHISDLKKLDSRVKAGNHNKAPIWWQLNDQVYQLMYPGKKMANVDLELLPSETETKKAESTAIIIPLKKEIEEKIKNAELDNWVALIQNDKNLRLEIQLPILFGAGKSDIAKEYITFFKKLSTVLKPYQFRVEVSGYTDGDPTNTKNYSSKMELGTKRANSVVKELVKTGIPPTQFKISSEGEYGANDPSKKSLNSAMKRRVEVNVFFKDAKV